MCGPVDDTRLVRSELRLTSSWCSFFELPALQGPPSSPPRLHVAPIAVARVCARYRSRRV
jgi:hypothetical protein